MPKHAATHQALIIGGGFGGYYAAHGLVRHGIGTTIVDRHGYQIFQPMLYQAASGLMRVADIEYPLTDIAGADVVTGSAVRLDLDACSATLDDGRVVDGDYLVLATGASVDFFGVPGAEEHALPLYTTDDARSIKGRLQALVAAEAAFSVVVIGAGATGVEITGAVADSIDFLLPRTFPQFRRESVALHIVDHAAAPLSHMSPDSQRYARGVLEGVGVEFHLGRRVTAVSAAAVALDDGATIDADLVIWAGGLSVRTPELAPAPLRTPGGRVVVNDDLRIPGHDRIYCVGDASAGSTTPLPQLGSVAKQQGIHVAESIRRQVHGHQPKPFRYRDMGDMAMVRHDAAVVEVGAHHEQVEGTTAYLMWLGLHAYLLPGDRHRVDAVRSWVHEQVTGTSPYLAD